MTQRPGERFDLFISYARRDARVVAADGAMLDVVATLKAALERHTAASSGGRRRFRVCTDLDDFALEGDFEGLLRDRIARSDAFLLVCSPGAALSPYVTREVAIAADQRERLRLAAAALGARPETVAPNLFGPDAVAADLAAPLGASCREWRYHLVRESHKVAAAALGLDPRAVHDRFAADVRRKRRNIGLAGAIVLASAGGLTVGLAGELGYHRVRTLDLPEAIVAPAGVAWTAAGAPVLVADDIVLIWPESGPPRSRRLPFRALRAAQAEPGVLAVAGLTEFAFADLNRPERAIARRVEAQVEGIAAEPGLAAVATESGDLVLAGADGEEAAPRPTSQRGRRFAAFRELGPYRYGGILALHRPWLASVDDQGRLAILNIAARRFVIPDRPQFPLAAPVERTRDPVLYETENTRPIGALAFTAGALIFGDGEGLKRVSLPDGSVRALRHCALELPRHIEALDEGNRLLVFTTSTFIWLEREADPFTYRCRQTTSLAPKGSPRVALSPDGRSLLIAYFDGAPEIWRRTFRIFGWDAFVF